MESILFLIISIAAIIGTGIMAYVLSQRIGVTEENMPISLWFYVAWLVIVEIVAYLIFIVGK